METFWGEVIAGDNMVLGRVITKKNLGVKRGLWVVTGQTQKDITGFMDQFTK